MPIAALAVAFSLKMRRHSAGSRRSESARRGGAPSYANSRMVGRTALVETLEIYKALQILQLGLLVRQPDRFGKKLLLNVSGIQDSTLRRTASDGR